MADHPKIVALDRYQTGESANPSPEKILVGIPRVRVSNQFTDPTQQFFCGFWSSTSRQVARALYRVRAVRAHRGPGATGVIAGRARHDFRAGDAFLVPAGYEGTWEVAEPCKKWYAVFESKI